MESTEDRKGLCNNIGVCSKANSNEVQVIADPFAEFICSECGMQLEETSEEKPKRKMPKWIIPIVVGVIALGLLAVFLPPLFRTEGIRGTTKSYEDQVIPIDSLNSSSVGEENASVQVPEGKKPEVRSNIGNTKDKNNDELVFSTLEDGLQKIGNASYSISNRKALITKVLTKFESMSIPVKVLRGNDEYEYFKVKQYMDRILIQGIHKISIVNQTKNNSGLISELIVNEK